MISLLPILGLAKNLSKQFADMMHPTKPNVQINVSNGQTIGCTEIYGVYEIQKSNISNLTISDTKVCKFVIKGNNATLTVKGPIMVELESSQATVTDASDITNPLQQPYIMDNSNHQYSIIYAYTGTPKQNYTFLSNSFSSNQISYKGSNQYISTSKVKPSKYNVCNEPDITTDADENDMFVTVTAPSSGSDESGNGHGDGGSGSEKGLSGSDESGSSGGSEKGLSGIVVAPDQKDLKLAS
ncbi:hypothetical protein TVAG_442350 [Trichomonas vaginalis G3]|uniref:Uncharacterized protein n=1 Tax=Trichomonas vaginalis (strain ATCC PRA-98 / G3) TaxID=412133 RepID=A2G129_TRIV3|nr:hypothetical protein TVAGG3_0792740 [Trichomonas vaginalis G3]EAX89132.1 hypothetical protein TVAG_442350 [Trichomonas vaginalis G3]KAI5495923.1 hypothetical protein TVAGG3_0792740 [Trichomonas vaginalis G3]|eukprot:XP_001302062.1 hypothetical protein [Trichomonas vaginalis G3]